MRSIVATCIVVGTSMLSIAGASAQNPGNQYYWEEGGRYGWSPSPQGAVPVGPAQARPGESLWSFCARQVGRTMRVDSNGLTRSATLTDACARSGGRV